MCKKNYFLFDFHETCTTKNKISNVNPANNELQI